MPNTRSAKKAVRTIARRTAVNGARRSRMRTYIRKVEEAIARGDKAAAQEALRTAEPEIARGGQIGVFHRNAAARTVSRLSRRIKALEA